MELFWFTDELQDKLSLLGSRDPKYKKIVNLIKKNVAFLNEHFLLLTTNYEASIKEVNQNTADAIINYHESINNQNMDLQNKSNLSAERINALNIERDKVLKDINLEFNRKIENLNHDINEVNEQYREKETKKGIVLTKEIKNIEHQITSVKKEFANRIARLEERYVEDFNKLTEEFNQEKQSLEESIVTQKLNNLELKEQYKQKIKEHREISDKKYIEIKTLYHSNSSKFNKQIDCAKKIKDNEIKLLNDEYKSKLIPIDEKIKETTITYNQTKSLAFDDYIERSKVHSLIKDKIDSDFEEQKQRIIKETSESITLLNSKLIAYKDSIKKELQDIQKDVQLQLDSTQSHKEKERIRISFVKLKRQFDYDLNSQILRTQKDEKDRLRNQYDRIFQTELQYLAKKSEWLEDLELLQFEFNQSKAHIDLLFQYGLKDLNLELKKLKIMLDMDIKLAELKYLKDIRPFNSDMQRSNAIQERDIDLLTNETNNVISSFQAKQDELELDFQHFVLDVNHQISMKELEYNYNKNVMTFNHQLKIEKENIRREHHLSRLELRKEITETTYSLDLQNTEEEIKIAESKYQITSEYEKKLNQNLLNHMNERHFLDIKKINTSNDYYELTLRFEEEYQKTQRDSYILNEELSGIHHRINLLFDQLYAIYKLNHHFVKETINLYQIPAHPDDIKDFIGIFLESLEKTTEFINKCMDLFLYDLTLYHEQKINDLSNLRCNTRLEYFKNVKNDKIRSLQQRKELINKNVTNIEHQIISLQNICDKSHNQINALETKIPFLPKEEVKLVKSEINLHQKQIYHLEKDIIKFEGQITSLETPISDIDESIEKTEKKYLKKERILQSKQSKHTKFFIRQLEYYKSAMKKFKNNYSKHVSKIKWLMSKLSQPLYLTNTVVKNFEEDYKAAEYQLQVNSAKIFHMLLDRTMRLFNQLADEHAQIKEYLFDKFQKDSDIFNKAYNDIQVKLESTESTHKSAIVDINNDKEQEIIQSTKQIQSRFIIDSHELRNKVQALESKLITIVNSSENEIRLVDENFVSVQRDLESELEHDKHISNSSHQKQANKIIDQLKHLSKNSSNQEELRNIKSVGINNKFNNVINKISIHSKELDNSYNSSYEKIIKQNKKEQEAIVNEHKEIKKDNYIRNRNFKAHGKTIMKRIHIKVKKILHKEQKDARKSYNFKKRTLRI